MRLGICTDTEKAHLVKSAGFDYYEAKLFDMESVSEEKFSSWLSIQEENGILCEAMNCMLSQKHRVTGPEANHDEIQSYLNEVIPRAAKLGCKTIVFGSAWSRNMPEGFSDRAKAYEQIVVYLHMASDICGENGITIAIEPLAASVTNIVSFVAEGNYLCSMVERKNVRLLADYYATCCNRENIHAVLVGYAPVLTHLHFSADNRKYPRLDDEFDYAAFFTGVKDSGYDGRISIEASHIGDELEDMKEAMRVFRQYL